MTTRPSLLSLLGLALALGVGRAAAGYLGGDALESAVWSGAGFTAGALIGLATFYALRRRKALRAHSARS